MDAALAAGALGAFVSGAGPSILALCSDQASAGTVLDDMAAAAANANVPGRSLALGLTQAGAHVVED
jgi:homoserine kinase